MEQFIEELLAAKGIPADLDKDIRAEIVGDLTEKAVTMVNRDLARAMSKKSAEAFAKLIDDPDLTEERLQAFIDEHVPDKEQIALASLLRFRELYLGDDARKAE